MMDSNQGFRLPTLLKAASLSKSTYYFEIGKPDMDAKNREAIELIQPSSRKTSAVTASGE